MLNTYSPWGELALQPQLTVEWVLLAGDRLGQYVDATLTIQLDPRMCRRQARSVLAHELRHAEYGDVVTDCTRGDLAQERRADREASHLMINVHDLARALTMHDQHLSATAVELGVSDDLLAVRFDHLHPAERQILRDYVGAIRVA